MQSIELARARHVYDIAEENAESCLKFVEYANSLYKKAKLEVELAELNLQHENVNAEENNVNKPLTQDVQDVQDIQYFDNVNREQLKPQTRVERHDSVQAKPIAEHLYQNTSPFSTQNTSNFLDLTDPSNELLTQVQELLPKTEQHAEVTDSDFASFITNTNLE